MTDLERDQAAAAVQTDAVYDASLNFLPTPPELWLKLSVALSPQSDPNQPYAWVSIIWMAPAYVQRLPPRPNEFGFKVVGDWIQLGSTIMEARAFMRFSHVLVANHQLGFNRLEFDGIDQLQMDIQKWFDARVAIIEQQTGGAVGSFQIQSDYELDSQYFPRLPQVVG